MHRACAVDSSLFEPAVPVIIQGITGRAGRTHAQLMQRYGTKVVGGVAASGSLAAIAGIPVARSQKAPLPEKYLKVFRQALGK